MPLVPVRIQPFFFLVAFLIGWLSAQNFTGAIIWVIVITFSILIHEFGHALTAVFFGQKARIDLVAFGGLTTRHGKAVARWKNFLITLNGPLAGLTLALIAFQVKQIVSQDLAIVQYALMVTVYVNFFWTFLNLLPVQPLDGGQLLGIVCEGTFGLWGTKLAVIISFAFSLLVAFLLLALGALLPAMIFLLFTFENYRMFRTLKHVTLNDQDQKLQSTLNSAQEAYVAGEKEKSEEIARKLLLKVKKGMIFVHTSQLLGRIYFDKNEKKKAFDLLKSVKQSLEGDLLRKFFEIGCELKEWEVVNGLTGAVYQVFPETEIAKLGALTHAALGEVKPTLGWLTRAKKDGAGDLSEFTERSEFDKMRSSKDFQAVFGSNPPSRLD